MDDFFDEVDSTTKYATVAEDEITSEICNHFGIQFNGTSEFEPLKKYIHPSTFNIGLIVGTSGGGKTTLLYEYNKEEETIWDGTKSIASHFPDTQSASKAFMGVGLNTVPSWLKPYHVLSNGEKYRADMAIRLKDNSVFDEFTSIVDRNTAKSMALGIGKYIRKEDFKNVVFASPHKDIIEWLEPDWVYDVDLKTITLKDSLRQRDSISIKFRKNEKSLWGLFSKHHYLDKALNVASEVYTAYWDDVLVGMVAVLTLPSGTIKNAYRFHRLVVLPEFQGMGIGMNISNAIGQYYLDQGKVIYGKTAHPKVGEYRERSPLWKPSSKNKSIRKNIASETNKESMNWTPIYDRPSYSHQFIGNVPLEYITNDIDLDEW